MKKYFGIMILYVCALLAQEAGAVHECNELKKYTCPYNDYLESAIKCCLENHPDDVDECVYCTFEGVIDEEDLKKEIEKVKQKIKAKKID